VRTLNDLLRQLRKDQHLTMDGFGEKLGVSRSVINNLERGVVKLKDPMLSLICQTFKVNRAWLETGEGEMYCPEMDDVLTLLAQKYQLDDRKMALIRAYLELSEERQEAVLAYAQGVADCLAEIGKANAFDEERRYEEATGVRRNEDADTG